MHGFVSRDGTPPKEFRRIAREQLAPYDSVETRSALVTDISGSRGEFEVRLADGIVNARSIVLCVGMIDELPDTPGYRELWGTAVFQCPYCHGWEVRGQAFGYIAPSAEKVEWAMFLRGWTRDVRVFTDDKFEVPSEVRERLVEAGVSIEERRIRRLITSATGERLEAVELENGVRVPRDVLFVRPPQRQTELVSRIGLELDEQGYVRVNEQKETSTPGIYAAGDLTTQSQAALLAAAAGAQAAYALNHALTMEMATGTTSSP
jgi:thioredoxin reductase